jgi:hypothetical protein
MHATTPWPRPHAVPPASRRGWPTVVAAAAAVVALVAGAAALWPNATLPTAVPSLALALPSSAVPVPRAGPGPLAVADTGVPAASTVFGPGAADDGVTEQAPTF